MKKIDKMSLDKIRILKNDSITCKINEIDRLTERMNQLLLQCILKKYYWDITLNNVNNTRGEPFVFHDKIDDDEFIDQYLISISTLYNVLFRCIKLFDCQDIIDQEGFKLALQKCLANCFALYKEYKILSNNMEDFSDCGCPIDYSYKRQEINETMDKIIESIVNSSLNKLNLFTDFVDM